METTRKKNKKNNFSHPSIPNLWNDFRNLCPKIGLLEKDHFFLFGGRKTLFNGQK